MTQEIKNSMEIKKGNATRKKSFLILGSVVVVLSLVYGIYYYIAGSKYVTTDNAYVAAEIAQVTSPVGGTVKEIKYNDTDKVRAGDVLVIIDDIDIRLMLKGAEADFARAQVDFERAKTDYTRRVALQKSKSVSEEEVTTARNAFKAAEALLQKALVAPLNVRSSYRPGTCGR